jgi:hypothetical protein
MTKEKVPFSEYEQIVQSIIQQKLSGIELDAPVIVEHNSKLRGVSGYEHQIDVSFSCSMIGVKLLFLVECKYYNKKVSVEDILAFKARIDDIRAHKGVFVTTEGYQKGALTFAKQNGIALVTVKALSPWIMVLHCISRRTIDDVQDYLKALKDPFIDYNGGISSSIKTGFDRVGIWRKMKKFGVASGVKTLIGRVLEKFGVDSISNPYDIHGVFFQNKKERIVFEMYELSVESAKVCDYTPENDGIVFKIDNDGSAIESERLIKYLICREMCK